MKIASWNVNSLRVRLQQVLEWLSANPVDVLAMQETKTQDDAFPLEAIEGAGYQAVFSGQKTYNGVAILSRKTATDIDTDIPQLEDPQRRILAATIGGYRILNLYVVNGSEVGSDKFDYKLNWLQKITDYVCDQVAIYKDFIILGDFNIAPMDADVHDPELWRERILCSTSEREALQRLMDCGFVDTFRLFDQPPKLFSWWDYRGGGFRRNHGLRIDLILASHKLAGQCTQSVIDIEPRTWERPSDHAPVVAEFSAAG